MNDYTDLVRSLRFCATTAKCGPECMCYVEGAEICSTAFDHDDLMKQAADAIEELQRICNAMKPKYDAVCAKCACYAEAEYNDNGFMICPASGMDITAWDYCSYFEKARLPEEEPGCGERLEPPKEE